MSHDHDAHWERFKEEKWMQEQWSTTRDSCCGCGIILTRPPGPKDGHCKMYCCGCCIEMYGEDYCEKYPIKE